MTDRLTRGARRPWMALLAGGAAFLLATSPALATASWGAATQVSPDHARSQTSASLARTATSTTSYLHSVFTETVINGASVADDGPALGVYYRRGNSSGSSWGTAFRVNGSAEHGDMGVIAASGKYVYVAYRTQTHIGAAYNPNDPRPIRFRRNTNHGSSTAWGSRVTLTITGSRSDRPRIAASGAHVWVTWTDGLTGEIRLIRSDDYGVTWGSAQAVGASDNFGDGYTGQPTVAATGSTVGVSYNTSGGVSVNVSTTLGDTWLGPVPITGAASNAAMVAAGRGGRLGFGWMTATTGRVVIWQGGSLGPVRTFASFTSTATYKKGVDMSLALYGTGQVGIAYSACTTTACSRSSTAGINLRLRESLDNGATWKSSTTIAAYSSSSARRSNVHPSLVYASSSRRLVTWIGRPASGSSARVYVKLGTGTP
ncbi:MAG: sialidase family protein [Candidatus Limnocylindrales bacterium]